MEFSVLMSVYEKETAQNLKQCLDSVLINQSILPNEVVLVKDGKLTDELDSLIDNYKERFNTILKIVELEKNSGLGEALNVGLKYCSYELVARMDSDDISTFNRFKYQLDAFKGNNDLDMVGGYISEFFSIPEKIEFVRKVPTSFLEIKKMLKTRNPINHVSVMFKKSAVIEAGGYRTLLFLEDYYLWVRMVAKEMNIQNISENLVLVRTGESMFKRRSNKEYISSWIYLQKIMLKESLINRVEYLRNAINIIVFIYIPPKAKKYIYKRFLRSNV